MKLLEKYTQEIEDFVGVCHQLSRTMYVTGTGGNLAWKLDDDLILITPTQMNKGDITRDDVIFITPDGKTVEGRFKPTGEMPMYLEFFDQRPDIVSVIHCHPPSACAFAIREGQNWLMRPFFPETTTEVGPVPVVPYAEPLTEKLAENFSPYVKKYNSFLMENHGVVTMSRDDIKWTMMNIDLLEMSARSILYALQIGEVKEISREGVRDLENVMKTRSLPLFGVPGVNSSLEELYFEDGRMG